VITAAVLQLYSSLRQSLNKDFNSMDWYKKFDILCDIARGLSNIHRKGLVHQDFHSGNILQLKYNSSLITDLGLCKPADEKSEKNVYGVLPYVAPEVLRGKEYTQASDIYAFGIIIYEVIGGLPPYHNMAHNEFLAIKICQGLRPKFSIKVPQLVEDIFKQCVDADPLKRPTANYLSYEKFGKWRFETLHDENSEIHKQIKEVDEFNKKQPTFTNSLNDTELVYTTHPQAIYTSRLLNFKNLPEPKNADNNESDYSGN
jgi:serine/threonine protein kinase